MSTRLKVAILTNNKPQNPKNLAKNAAKKNIGKTHLAAYICFIKPQIRNFHVSQHSFSEKNDNFSFPSAQTSAPMSLARISMVSLTLMVTITAQILLVYTSDVAFCSSRHLRDHIELN